MCHIVLAGHPSRTRFLFLCWTLNFLAIARMPASIQLCVCWAERNIFVGVETCKFGAYRVPVCSTSLLIAPTPIPSRKRFFYCQWPLLSSGATVFYEGTVVLTKHHLHWSRHCWLWQFLSSFSNMSQFRWSSICFNKVSMEKLLFFLSTSVQIVISWGLQEVAGALICWSYNQSFSFSFAAVLNVLVILFNISGFIFHCTSSAPTFIPELVLWFFHQLFDPKFFNLSAR